MPVCVGACRERGNSAKRSPFRVSGMKHSINAKTIMIILGINEQA